MGKVWQPFAKLAFSDLGWVELDATRGFVRRYIRDPERTCACLDVVGARIAL